MLSGSELDYSLSALCDEKAIHEFCPCKYTKYHLPVIGTLYAMTFELWPSVVTGGDNI